MAQVLLTFYRSSLFFFIVTAISWSFIYCYLYPANAPWHDDIRFIVDFIIQYHETTLFSEQLNLLFRQSNEHRALVANLVYVATNVIHGSINFKFLVILGNACMLVIYSLHLNQLRDSKHKLFIAAGLSLIMFQFYSHYYFTWALAFQFNIVYPLAYLSFIYFFKFTWLKLLLALFTGFLCIVSMSNGLLILPAVVCILFFLTIRAYLQHLTSDKNSNTKTTSVNQNILFSAVFIAGLGSIIFLNMLNLQTNYTLFAKITTQLPQINGLLLHYLYLIGAAYSYQHYEAGVIIGSVFLLLILWLFIQGYPSKRPALMAFLLFLLATLIPIVIIRSDPNNTYIKDISYYNIISMNIIAITFIAYCDLYLARLVYQKLAKIVIILLLSMTWLFSYALKSPALVDTCKNYKSWQYILNDNLLTGKIQPRDHSDEVLLLALQRGYVDPYPAKNELPLAFIPPFMQCQFNKTVK